MTASVVTRRFAAALLLLLAVGLAACSSDDGGTESAGGDTTTDATEGTDDTSGEDDGPTAEQCAALGSLPDAQADVEELVALFPEELQEDVRQFREEAVAYLDSIDPATGEPTAPEPQGSEALLAFSEGCSEAGGDDTGPATATFTYGDIQVTGESAVISVSGACSDGSFPTDVELVYGPFSATAAGEDLGGGEYSFTIDVAAGATAEQLQVELGLEPDFIDSSITGTCG